MDGIDENGVSVESIENEVSQPVLWRCSPNVLWNVSSEPGPTSNTDAFPVNQDQPRPRQMVNAAFRGGVSMGSFDGAFRWGVSVRRFDAAF